MGGNNELQKQAVKLRDEFVKWRVRHGKKRKQKNEPSIRLSVP